MKPSIALSMSEDLDRLFIDTFRVAALQAGAVALHLRGKVAPEIKSAGTAEAEAVTAVDLATQDVILHLLHRHLPEVAVDAEEDTDTLAFFAEEEPGRLPGARGHLLGDSGRRMLRGWIPDAALLAGRTFPRPHLL